MKELPSEVYSQKIESVFSSIEEVVRHIYQTDGMWLSVISGDSFEETMTKLHQLQEESTSADFDGIQQCYDKISAQYTNFLKKQDNPDEIISIEHPHYGKMETAVSSLIQHVVNHGTYHRGNITAMLRQQGYAGIPTDFIFYLHEVEKGAEFK